MSATIGSRWRPGHVERRDTETGLYESINSRIDSATELMVQSALLSTVPKWVEQRIELARNATTGESK